MSVILFAVAALVNSQGTHLQGVLGNQLRVLIPLYLGFCFTFIALGTFIVSQNALKNGNSNIWLFSFGEIFQFIAFAQTISGIMLLFMDMFSFALVRSPEKVFTGATIDSNFMAASSQLFEMIFWLSAAGWFIMTYLVPLFTFYRIPIPNHKSRIIFFAYFFLLMIVFSITGGLYHLLGLAGDPQYGRLTPFLDQLIQPILWKF